MVRFRLIPLLLPLAVTLSAQPHKQALPTNFGLSAPQEAADLPRSEAPVRQPVRLAKRLPQPRLEALSERVWTVTGGWELSEDGTGEWLDATVPGTVLTTLVDQGVYPDPCYGLDNLAIPDDLCRKTWLYRTEVPLGPGQLGAARLELLFEGINYRAEVRFNGTRLGRIDGAFIRGRFDVTALAREHNLLEVKIFPPPNPGIPHEQSARTGRGPNGGMLCLDGPTFIASEGWDWMPGVRDRNIGIWQDVRLLATDGLVLGDTQVRTDLPLPSTAYADVSVTTTVSNTLPADRTVRVTAETDGLSLSGDFFVRAGATVPVRLQGRMEAPRLWMPNGYGEPNLYDLRVDCSALGRVSDRQDIRFGVRELSYELSVDAPGAPGLRIEYDPAQGAIFDNRQLRPVGNGVEIPSLRPSVDVSSLRLLEPDATAPYLVIRVNGIRIFCRGGNWGMDDLLKRVSRERLEPFFVLHRAAGFNMVRNWTGESTEEAFYALCDEYGLLVWNDFWMSTEGYNLPPHDEDLFLANATDAVRRFRNHPCIALWCPRNEGYAPEGLERKLSEMIAAEDGTRHYHPNSRYCCLRPSGPWHYFPEAARYAEMAAGFNTELGSPSIPTAATMRKFLPEPDLWPVGDAWHYHDYHHPEVEAFGTALERLYGPAAGLDDFCRKAQLMGYDSYRAMIEAWNGRMWDSASGILLWMSHPAWPSVEWQTYSRDGETTGAWFGAKKACEPLHVQMQLADRQVIVINSTPSSRAAVTVRAEVFSLAGKRLFQVLSAPFAAPADARTLPDLRVPEQPGVTLVRLTLLEGKTAVSVNEYLCSPEGFRVLETLPAATLRARPLGGGRVEIRNTGHTVAVGILPRLLVGDAPYLPAPFSDGGFHLLPGERRVITLLSGPAGGTLSVEGFNIPSAPLCPVKM